jgi:large repetitive protein
MRKLVLIALASLAAVGLFAQLSSAAFTSSTTLPSNGITADALRNYFSVSAGSDVQPGTSNPVGGGNVDGFSIDLGTVPSARTFSSVFQITNVSGASRTATISLSGVPQVSSAVFASSGGATATLAAGASTTLKVTTSSTVAGRGTGTLRLGLSGSSWLYRDYSFRVDEAPEAPAGTPTGVQKPAGRIDLAWTASSTTTNFAGYNIYRSSGGGAYTKLNTAPQTALTFSDTTTVDGTAYTYTIRAVTSGAPVLESLNSTTVSVTADATAPGQASSITLANGGGAGGAYINAANAGSISVNVALPAGSLTTDVVELTVTRGTTITQTKAGTAGAGTLTFTGLNLAGMSDGGVTFTIISTDLAGNVSTAKTVTITKDTVAPAAPTASYTDNNGVADVVTGTAEPNASIKATKALPLPAGATYNGTANGSGSYSVTVALVDGSFSNPITVRYTVTATDAAGNTSAATTLNATDRR